MVETAEPSGISILGWHASFNYFFFLIPIPAFFFQLNCCGLMGGVEQFISDTCPKKQILESIQVKVKLEQTSGTQPCCLGKPLQRQE